MLTVIPSDGQIFIYAHPLHCKVSRFYSLAGSQHHFGIQTATNWQDLEPEAHAAAEAQIGAITGDEYLPCPPELAARATWPATIPHA